MIFYQHIFYAFPNSINTKNKYHLSIEHDVVRKVRNKTFYFLSCRNVNTNLNQLRLFARSVANIYNSRMIYTLTVAYSNLSNECNKKGTFANLSMSIYLKIILYVKKNANLLQSYRFQNIASKIGIYV